MPFLIISLLLLLLLFITILYFTIAIINNKNKIKNIPGVWQLFVLPWHIPYITKYLYLGVYAKILDFSKEFGDLETGTFRVTLPSRNVVFFFDPLLIKEICVTKASYFAKPKRVYESFNVFGENILSVLDNEDWKKHHKICAPAFSVKSLEYMCQTASNSVDLLRETKWDKLLKNNNNNSVEQKGFVLDLGDYSDATLDILGKAGFGIDFSIFSENAEGSKFRHALEIFIQQGVIIRRFLHPYPLLLNIIEKITGLDKHNQLINDKLEEIINKRQLELSEDGILESNDLLSLLVEANNQEKGILTKQELKSNAAIFALAGHETTSTLLQWITYELAKHPEIQERARREVDKVLENQRKPNYDDYGNLNYINAIIAETLRYHPPVAGVVKTAKKDVQIGKFFIPKGTSTSIQIYSLNKSEKVWKNANQFNPERFIDPEIRQKVQHDFTWIPFSMGARKCIGFQFALLEACMVLSRLMQFYEFELLNDESKVEDRVVEKAAVTIRPKNLRVLVKHR